MSKRSSRRDFFSLIKFSKNTRQQDNSSSSNNNSNNSNSNNSNNKGTKLGRHESLNTSKHINKNKNIFNNYYDDTSLSGKIYKLVEKEKFEECVNFIKELTHDQVDDIAKDLPVGLILKKIPKSLRLIEALYSKNTRYFSDKNRRGLTNSMPPDILLNSLVAWIYSLEEQKSNAKTFQHYRHLFVKTLRHIFASSPVLRNKLTKKLISLERSLDSVSQETCNPLRTIHPLLLKARTERCPSKVKSDGVKPSRAMEQRSEESCDSWTEGIEQLKENFITTFHSLTSEQSSSTGRDQQETLSTLTIESIERRLYQHRRILDAVEPLESIIVHVTKQLRRSMEADKEVVFNCIQLSKELNLFHSGPELANLKRPLTSALSAPLAIGSDPLQQAQAPPSSKSAFTQVQPSRAKTLSVQPQPTSVSLSPSASFSTFFVLPFLGRMVRSYSKVVAMITDDQLGPRVVFSTNTQKNDSLVTDDCATNAKNAKKKTVLSSHSFSEFRNKDADVENIVRSSSSGANKKYHTLPKSTKNERVQFRIGEERTTIKNETPTKKNHPENQTDGVPVSCGATQLDPKVMRSRSAVPGGCVDDDGKNLMLRLEKASKELESSRKIIRRLSGLSKRSSSKPEKVSSIDKQLIGLYGTMYHVTRSEMMAVLNKIKELEGCDQLKSKLALSIFVLSFRSAKKCHHRLHEEVKVMLDSHLDERESRGGDHLWVVSESINLYLQKSSINEQLLQTRSKEVYEKVTTTLEHYPCLRDCVHLLHYVENSLRLCWFIVLKNPSLQLFYDGKTFEADLHDRSSTSDPRSSTIKTFLWPGLREGNEGRCFCKAIVFT